MGVLVPWGTAAEVTVGWKPTDSAHSGLQMLQWGWQWGSTPGRGREGWGPHQGSGPVDHVSFAWHVGQGPAWGGRCQCLHLRETELWRGCECPSW